jgi:uncharacterized short protein YbdD (DUF466 family)
VRQLIDALMPPASRPPAARLLAAWLSRAWSAASRLRHGWLETIGAPDYKRYLAHHREHHPDTQPMSERDYVKLFIERRYNRRGAGRCC